MEGIYHLSGDLHEEITLNWHFGAGGLETTVVSVSLFFAKANLLLSSPPTLKMYGKKLRFVLCMLYPAKNKRQAVSNRRHINYIMTYRAFSQRCISLKTNIFKVFSSCFFHYGNHRD